MLNFIFLQRPYYIYILILIPLFMNLYWQYSVDNLASSVFAGFCIGTVLNSWFFCNYQDKLFKKSSAFTAKVMKENFELKQENFKARMDKFGNEDEL